MLTSAPRVLAFDVFGTVVDWRSSVIGELEMFGERHGLAEDWPSFADAWRAGYAPAMNRVRSGDLPWLNLDALHRMILDELLDGAGIDAVPDDDVADLNRVWHRLDPWPDAVRGLALLKQRFVITTLSNGNVALLTNMAKRAALPWDCVLSAETFRHYKPDAEVYRGCAELLDVAPGEVMMVAAHPSDLRAARDAGLTTAYIRRPLERGPGVASTDFQAGEFDLVADDLLDLSTRLDELADR